MTSASSEMLMGKHADHQLGRELVAPCRPCRLLRILAAAPRLAWIQCRSHAAEISMPPQPCLVALPLMRAGGAPRQSCLADALHDSCRVHTGRVATMVSWAYALRLTLLTAEQAVLFTTCANRQAGNASAWSDTTKPDWRVATLAQQLLYHASAGDIAECAALISGI